MITRIRSAFIGIANPDRLQYVLSASYTGIISVFFLLMVTSCGSLVTSATNNLANNLVGAMADHDDVTTVEAGGPAYLLLMDAMVRSNPEDPRLLAKASGLYAAYASAFAQDPERTIRLTDRALEYAMNAVCLADPAHCSLRQVTFEQFEHLIAQLSSKQVPIFYTLGAAWAGWIQARKDDFNAVAELARVELLMRRIVSLNENHSQGGAHLYLGTLSILLPPALGGKPEASRHHFERAIELSQGRNLMAKVLYAQHYARMLFDRPLHDRLLKDVVEADPYQPGYVLLNTMAQEHAERLLETASDYF